MNKIVNNKVLEIYYKYDEDLTLLYEPWADKKDRELISSEQSRILSEYIDKLKFLKVKNINSTFKNQLNNEILDLEIFIDLDVIKILRSKILL